VTQLQPEHNTFDLHSTHRSI